jgi:hypothetical protein
LILTKGELIGEDEAIRNIPNLYTVMCNSAFGELLEINNTVFREAVMANESSAKKVKEITRKKIGLQENRRCTSRTILSQIERGVPLVNMKKTKSAKKATLRVRDAVFTHFNKIRSTTHHRINETVINAPFNNNSLLLQNANAKLHIDCNSVPKPYSRGKHITIFMARRTLKDLLKKKAYYNC